jgi:hypothetical protein
MPVLNRWVCFRGEPIGMCERHDPSADVKGWGSAEAAFPVQLVNDLGFATIKAGFAIERLHPLRALSGQTAGPLAAA